VSDPHDPTPPPRNALAVDLGSGTLKVGVVSLSGEIVAVQTLGLETERGAGGAAVQDARAWWDAVRTLAKLLLAEVPARSVVAVACTGQWASTVPVDEAGEPVGPCLMWLDTRGAEHARAAIGGPVLGYSPFALAKWIPRTAGIPSPFGGDPVSHMLHLEHDDPRTAGAARWYLEPVDYLSMRFTGRAAATFASMSAAWLTDNRRLDRLAYDPVLVRKAGLPSQKLPPLVATGSLLGPVRAEVASELGLGPGEDVQVVTGLPDIHTSALGTGTVQAGAAHTTISTTSWISLPVTRKKTDPIHSIATIPGLDARGYLVANNQEAAGLCLTWLRGAMPGADRLDFGELIELASSGPPGSGGVIFTPWIAGERSPVDDRSARGGWHNISARTTTNDLVRAVLEGVAYNSRWLHHAVGRFAHRRLDPLRIFGGGAQSDLWCQIYADVLDVTIERVADPLHANLRGATLLAALALGGVQREQIRALVPVDRVFTPDPRNRPVYDRYYAEFARLYKAQRKMFGRLNRPTAGV
jgi:xylulokinase